MGFGAALRSLLVLSIHTTCERANRTPLATSRERQGFVILFLALVPVLGSAQVGRIFVSAEAYVGCARVVHVGKIVELKQIEYESEKPLTFTQKLGKPHQLVFEVSELIRGDDVERFELVLSLQSTHFLEYMREESVELMLVGGRNHLDTSPGAEIGIEEQRERVDGEWYQFRLLDPVEVPESGRGAAIASQLNKRYDSCRMFTNELEIVEGREAILKRVRAFAKAHTGMLAAVSLHVPNEFGALCGHPNAYCVITLPYCPSTRRTLAALKVDPGRVMRRIEARHENFDRSSMLKSIDKALAITSAADGDLFRNPVHLFEAVLIPALTQGERAKVQTTWRGFYLRTDTQSGLKNEYTPSAAGIYLDASVRDWVEVRKFTDTTTREEGITIRTVKFPASGASQVEGLVVTLAHGARANKEVLEAINRSIADIRRKAEPDGADQPATAPESKSERKDKTKPESEERAQ